MNTTGKKFGGRTKGTPNKLNSKIKDKLSSIISEAIDSFDIEDMTKAERLKLIQLGMPYIITKPQQEEIQEQHNITVLLPCNRFFQIRVETISDRTVYLVKDNSCLIVSIVLIPSPIC